MNSPILTESTALLSSNYCERATSSDVKSTNPLMTRHVRDRSVGIADAVISTKVRIPSGMVHVAR